MSTLLAVVRFAIGFVEYSCRFGTNENKEREYYSEESSVVQSELQVRTRAVRPE